MSNKTSDNVANIERLNNFANMTFLYGNRVNLNVSALKEIQNDIKNILSDYTRQKQINEEHQKINGELREKVKKLEEENRMFKNNKVLVSRYFKLKDNSIPKQKIEDKIEELKEENYQISLESKVVFDTGIMKNNLKIQVLQELLQESEDK